MYSTCLFCHAALGRNEVVEHFQVGRRLAFDSYRGRLWVVCKRCANWNLSPLEQRWEAVEECERIYRATVVRVSTENIGLATVREGLDLVRIGEPLRPEFAAWRYGNRIRTHRLRGLRTQARAAVGETGAMIAGAVASVAGLTMMLAGHQRTPWRMVKQLEQLEARLSYDRVLAHVRVPGGDLQPLFYSHISRLEIVTHTEMENWLFRIAYPGGVLDVDGPHAVQLAGQILSRINASGGSVAQVREATRRITDAGDAERYIRQSSALREFRRAKRNIFWNDDVGVLGLTSTERLALEIAVHEDAERQAMQGELAALEEAWRDAEEIAAIADAMFVPDGAV